MHKKILIVEDEPGAQQILQRMIWRIDYTAYIYCVDSAEEAYRTISSAAEDKEPFDLVLADLNLPSSDGLILKRVSQKKYPDLDFLVISGVSFEEWNKRSTEEHETGLFLRKPVTEQQLRLVWDQCFFRIGVSGS